MEIKKKNKSGTQSLGTLKYGNPVNQKEGTPNKWEKGTVCIERGSRLNGINQILISQNRPVKVLQFLGATIIASTITLKMKFGIFYFTYWHQRHL